MRGEGGSKQKKIEAKRERLRKQQQQKPQETFRNPTLTLPKKK